MSASEYDQQTQTAITFIHLLRGVGVLTGSPLEDGASIDIAPLDAGRATRALTLASTYTGVALKTANIEASDEGFNTFIGGAFGQALLVLTQDPTQEALRDAFGPLPTEEQS